jgi:hypothetical protein
MVALRNSKTNLLAVAILFLFTFFNLILDAPRRTSGTEGTPAAAGMLATHSLAGPQATAMVKATTATQEQQRCQKQYRRQQHVSFNRNSCKTRQNSKFFKKIQRKIVKITIFWSNMFQLVG